MIEKLYKLKQQQINQQVEQKQRALSDIAEIDKELMVTNTQLHTAGVQIMGAISDFRVLQIHKETMKEHMIKLAQKKEHLNKQIEYYDSIIVDLNKESEQFNYILQEIKREKIKEIQKQEDNVASEYMQVKFINQRMEQNAI